MNVFIFLRNIRVITFYLVLQIISSNWQLKKGLKVASVFLG